MSMMERKQNKREIPETQMSDEMREITLRHGFAFGTKTAMRFAAAVKACVDVMYSQLKSDLDQTTADRDYFKEEMARKSDEIKRLSSQVEVADKTLMETKDALDKEHALVVKATEGEERMAGLIKNIEGHVAKNPNDEKAKAGLVNFKTMLSLYRGEPIKVVIDEKAMKQIRETGSIGEDAPAADMTVTTITETTPISEEERALLGLPAETPVSEQPVNDK